MLVMQNPLTRPQQPPQSSPITACRSQRQVNGWSRSVASPGRCPQSQPQQLVSLSLPQLLTRSAPTSTERQTPLRLGAALILMLDIVHLYSIIRTAI